MKVVAKYQIAYKDVLYLAGDKFEMNEQDYEKYQNDVILPKKGKKTAKKVSNKQVKKSSKK